METPAPSPADSPLRPSDHRATERLRALHFLNLNRAGNPENGGNPPEKYSTNRLTIETAPVILNQMVDYKLDATFHALADPTRRGMLAHLMRGEQSVGELARPFAMSLTGASKHVKVLEDAGLVTRSKRGRTYFCRLEPKPLAEADQWLRQWEKFWTASLDRLEALIQAEREQRP